MLRTYENVPKLRENGRNNLVHWPNYNIIRQKGISDINDDEVSEESEYVQIIGNLVRTCMLFLKVLNKHSTLQNLQKFVTTDKCKRVYGFRDNRGHEMLQVALNGNDFHAINFSEDFKIKYGFWKILFLILIVLILVITFVCCYRYLFLKLCSVYQRMLRKRSTESIINEEQNLLESWIVAKKDSVHEDFEPLINQEKKKLLCNEENLFESKNEYKQEFVKNISSSHSFLAVLKNLDQESFMQGDEDRIQIVMKDLATDLIFETQEKKSFPESVQNSKEIQEMEIDHNIMNQYEDNKLEVENVFINDAIINSASNKKIQIFDISKIHNKSNLRRSLSACNINRICIATRKYSDPGLLLTYTTEVYDRETCSHSKESSSFEIQENIGVEEKLFQPPRTLELVFKDKGAGESLNDYELIRNYDNLSMLLSHRMKQQIHLCHRKYCLLGRHLRKKDRHDKRKCQLRYTCYANYLGDRAADCDNGNICEDTYDEFEMMHVAPDQRNRLNRIIHERRRRFLG